MTTVGYDDDGTTHRIVEKSMRLVADCGDEMEGVPRTYTLDGRPLSGCTDCEWEDDDAE